MANSHGRHRMETWKNVAGYLAVLVLTGVWVMLAMRLWRADLWTPLRYARDNIFFQVLIKGTIENGWYLENPRLGMPLTQTMHDFPMSDSLHVILIKLLGYIFHDSALVLNLYCLLPFPVVAVSAYFVLRRFKVARWPAVIVGVLYACAPFHFVRGTAHLFLAAYYLLPLMTLVLVRIFMGRSPFLIRDYQRQSAACGLALGNTSEREAASGQDSGDIVSAPRWSFFRLEPLGRLAGVRADERGRRLLRLCLRLLPAPHGGHQGGFARSPTVAFPERRAAHRRHLRGRGCLADSVVSLQPRPRQEPRRRRAPGRGGRLARTQRRGDAPAMRDHHIRFLARRHSAYVNEQRWRTGEILSVAIGTVASVGFLWLMARFLWRRRERVERVEDALAYLAASAVVLGTIGGVGSLFNFYVSPMIRGYNRISIWIAFFALFGLALLAQRLIQRRIAGRLSWGLYSAGGCAVLLFGLVDQTVYWFVPAYDVWQSHYASDADFGRRMEAALPPGTMVYQLPYITFPEHPPVVGMGDYDLARPYLHTKTLRFSYGAMRGREASRFQGEIARLPLYQGMRKLAFTGFGAVYVDREGYLDHGAAIEKELARILGVEPIVSINKRHACFDMRRYVTELHRWHSDAEWKILRDKALHDAALASSPGSTSASRSISASVLKKCVETRTISRSGRSTTGSSMRWSHKPLRSFTGSIPAGRLKAVIAPESSGFSGVAGARPAKPVSRRRTYRTSSRMRSRMRSNPSFA